MVDKGFMGSGDVYLRNISVAGAGFVKIGNITNLTITPKTSKKKRMSSQLSTFGQTLDTVMMLDGCEMKMTSDTYNKENFILALAGTATDLLQTVAADEAVTKTLVLNEWVRLGKRKVTDVKVTVSSVLKVLNTDYEINSTLGLVRAIVAGCAGEASITFDAPAIVAGASSVIAGAKQAYILCELLLHGKNQVTGEEGELLCHQVRFSSNSAFSLISNDFNKFDLDGELETPALKSSPFDWIPIL